MRKLILSGLLSASSCASASYNPAIDTYVQAALSGVPLTEQGSPACDLYTRWAGEVTFPNTATHKELATTGSYLTPSSVDDIKTHVDRNVRLSQRSVWGPITDTGLPAPSDFKNFMFFVDADLPTYAVFLTVVPNAVSDQQAVCFAVLKGNVP